ncbi:glycerate kinase [Bifidobacterium sp.]|uniref:glycerate kinase n=1 Tax=Bifidobacterium sp. TaxID=41200 RepID=UPI002A90BB88|nr:glycerate kinase [Bifidobacterium sp.]MDY5368201.1 glycerate kinase [Bifidobacterium sp.]
MDSFKGSLDAVSACRAVVRGVKAVCPTACCDIAPMADGGEGTLDALLASVGGRRRSAMVHDPLMRPVRAEYGLLDAQNIGGVRGTAGTQGIAGARGFAGVRNAGNANRATAAEFGRVAVIEMARASGLQYVDEHTHDPLHTSTFGTGELIRYALDDGARTIIVTLGGSATNDGGAGIAQALGARLLDATGRDLEPGGAALARLDHIDTARMDPRLAHTEVRIATDVTNPLTGPTGASAVFGPQKGATPGMVRQLDDAFDRFAQVIERDLGRSVAAVPGSGAGGGTGAGLLAFTNATIEPGIQLVATASRLADRARTADVCITGEGRIDGQTAYGKTPAGVAHIVKQANPRMVVVALAGALARGVAAVPQAVAGSRGADGCADGSVAPTIPQDDADYSASADLYACGIDAVFPIIREPQSLADACRETADNLAATAANVARLLAAVAGADW